MNLEETKKIIENKIEAEALTRNVRSQRKSYIDQKQNLREGFKETFEPLIESQDAVKASIDKEQNELIRQFQENQLALTEGLDKNRLAITQGFDKIVEVKRFDLQQLPRFEAIEEDKPVSEGDASSLLLPSPPETPTVTFTDEDLNKGLGYEAAIDYLDSLNLKLPSELKEINLKDFEKNYLEKAEKKYQMIKNHN